ARPAARRHCRRRPGLADRHRADGGTHCTTPARGHSGRAAWAVASVARAGRRAYRTLVLTEESNPVTSVPEITRMLARIQEWQEGHGKAGGRTEAAEACFAVRSAVNQVRSLHSLRRRSLGLRGIQQYYAPVRFLAPVHHRIRLIAFPML